VIRDQAGLAVGVLMFCLLILISDD